MDIEILNEKMRDREEKPVALASPENVSKKKKRKMKQKDAETEQHNQQPSQVCHKPLVTATPISVEETPKKKKMRKKKSNLIGEQQKLNKKGGEVPNETNALAIEVPTDVEMKTESLSHGQSQSSHAEAEGKNQYPSQVCPQPSVVPIFEEANSVDPKDTPKKKKRGPKKRGQRKKDKSYLNGEQHESNKVEVLNETNPPKPSLAFEVPTELEMKTEALDYEQSQTKLHTPIRVSLIPQTSTLQPAIPMDTEQNLSKSGKKRKNKKMWIMVDGVQPSEHNIETPVQSQMSICHTPTPTINHTMDPHLAIPICPKPCSPIEQTIAVVEPAPQIGQTIPVNKNKRKRGNKKKRMLDGAQPGGHNIEQPETLVQSQTSICRTTTPPIDQTMDPHPAIPTFPIPVSPVKKTMDPCPAIPICSKPVSPVDPAISMDEPAPQIGQTIPVNKNKRKRGNKKKRMLDGAQPGGHNIEQPETLVQSQTSICRTTTPPIDQTMDPHPAIPTFPKPVSPVKKTMDPCPAIPICSKPVSPVDPAISMDEPAPQIGQTIPVNKSKRRWNKKKRMLDGAQSSGHNIEQPETLVQSQTSVCRTTTPPIDQTMDPHPAIPTFSKPVSPVKKTMDSCHAIPICSKPVSSINQTISVVDPALKICPEPAPQIGQTIPVDPAVSMDTEQKLSMSKRKKRNKRMKVLDGAQSNGPNIEQPGSPVQSQTSIRHTITPPIYKTTDLHTAIPICPKPSALIDKTNSVVDSALSIGLEPEPFIGQTIPVDPAIPIDTQQKLSMNNKQQKMTVKSLPSEEQPNGHNIKQLETPVQKPISPIDQEQKMTKEQRRMSALKTEGSESNGHNANLTTNARSKICWACRKSDHKINQCGMLKSLSKHEEVCFFCGEIGHSLGRCSVSLAGGGRLAKCLLCHADGHFSYNCPGDGHGTYLKQQQQPKSGGEFIVDDTNL